MATKTTTAQKNGSGKAMQPAAEPDFEALALAARTARAENCSQRINALLSEFNCELSIEIALGEARVPLAAVLALPGIVSVRPKS